MFFGAFRRQKTAFPQFRIFQTRPKSFQIFPEALSTRAFPFSAICGPARGQISRKKAEKICKKSMDFCLFLAFYIGISVVAVSVYVVSWWLMARSWLASKYTVYQMYAHKITGPIELKSNFLLFFYQFFWRNLAASAAKYWKQKCRYRKKNWKSEEKKKTTKTWISSSSSSS